MHFFRLTVSPSLTIEPFDPSKLDRAVYAIHHIKPVAHIVQLARAYKLLCPVNKEKKSRCGYCPVEPFKLV